MGQLEIILHALEQVQPDAVSDELHSTMSWYMDKLPGPGEEEEEAEARNNPQAAAAKALPGEDTPIPMPPGQEADGGKDLASLPEPPGKARLMKNAGGPKGKPGLQRPDAGPAPKTTSMDRELPPPPPE